MDQYASWHEARFTAFDTSVRLRIWGAPNAMRNALAKAKAECVRFEKLLSRTLPASDVSRLNAAHGTWTEVDPITISVIEAALDYCAASENTFDITIGALSTLWNLKRGIVPNADALAKAVAHVNWRRIHVDKAKRRVQLEDPLTMIDLGGIAKGWIADELERLFLDCGAAAWLIDLGGNILVGGEKPDGEPWRIGLPQPTAHAENAPPQAERLIAIRHGSVVTSGTYERTAVIDGVRYHHILNPKTGMPIETEYQAVSVVCERSLDAEGYSTTLLALGPERARTFISTHPEILQVYYTR